jgi:hypothetical protein
MRSEDLTDVQWLPPWGAAAPGLEHELAREVGPRHVLYGRTAFAVARRVDTDDVLFLLTEEPTILVVVHLTWTRRQELSSAYPQVELYSSVEEFIERCMKPNHAEYKNG